MGRQIRNPLTFKYPIHAPIWYIPNMKAATEEATYLAQKGNNSAYIVKQNGRISLAHEDQMRSREAPPQSSQPLPPVIKEPHMSSEQPEKECPDGQSCSDTPVKTPLRRSQRSNFGVPPIRWGACGVVN